MEKRQENPISQIGGFMQHRILGDNDCPILEIQLNPGERVKIERGSMAYMAGVELQGKMNSGANGGGLGGLLSAVGRSIAPAEKACLLLRLSAWQMAVESAWRLPFPARLFV